MIKQNQLHKSAVRKKQKKQNKFLWKITLVESQQASMTPINPVGGSPSKRVNL
jgi:hypothetical protein